MNVDLHAVADGSIPQFTLTLADGNQLDCLQVVRRVPGRRVVCRARWSGKAVYAKIFLGKGAARYAQRDQRGALSLAAAGIATPELLHAGALPAEAAQVLLYAEVAEAISADQAWSRSDVTDRSKLAFGLVREVALHHQAGLLQTDLYLKNFLVQGSVIYTLDGDGIRPLPRLFSRGAELQNLAILLGKLDVLDVWPLLPALLDQYARLRGWQQSPSLAKMKHMMAKQRYDLAQGYAQRKVLRQCSDVNVQVSSKRFLAISRDSDTPALRASLETPDRCLDANHVRLKSGNTCTVSLIQLGALNIVVKRYNIKNFWHGLNRALRNTRAAASWSNAYRLHLLGVATPEPVALLEQRIGCIRREAYFLAKYVDAPDVAQYFAAETDGLQSQATALEVARLFYQLYLLGIVHGDFKSTNMKIVHGKPMLIDLDSMRQYAPGVLSELRFRRGHVRDLRRFLRNWQPGAVVLDELQQAFVMTYKEPAVLLAAGINTKKI
ncbi:lipopolysaccharide kinase InaA family protein [Methylobacillus flagellatus]|uniref:lipopolysaccharide kinase InaA family protein n=1 Tax=Methylobacillus flagellatus TaxID=405 RepID=UPI0010F91510|nr:lipopolysaccharide kinase InaA family protein [Methylobacillus flagellatus]